MLGYFFKNLRDFQRTNKAVRWVEAQTGSLQGQPAGGSPVNRRKDSPARPAKVVCKVGGGWYKIQLLDLEPINQIHIDLVDCGSIQDDTVTLQEPLEKVEALAFSVGTSPLSEGEEILVVRLYSGSDFRPSKDVQIQEFAVVGRPITKPVTGRIIGYLGEGWYRVAPANTAVQQGFPRIPFEYSPFKPEDSGCRWIWSEESGTWSQQSSCGGICVCDPPPLDGERDGQILITQCFYEGTGCVAQDILIEWQQDGAGPGQDGWVVIGGGCDPDCAPYLPPGDDFEYGEQRYVSCFRKDRCDDAFNDPATLCDLPLQGYSGSDPDASVVRQISTPNPMDPLSQNWFLAYQTSKMTLAEGTGVLCVPYWGGNTFNSPVMSEKLRFGVDLEDQFRQGHWYMIVSAELPIHTVYIPTAFECCEDGSIRITRRTPMIVEGYACEQQLDPCPPPEVTP